MSIHLRHLGVAVMLGLTGCVAYNEECIPLVSSPDEITGWLGGDVTTVKSEVRTQNSVIGQLAAEAYTHAFDDQPEGLRPDIGLENAGSIRPDGVCSTRELLSKGPVKRKVLRDVLPFDDQVVVVAVTHHQLKNILEHAVAALAGSASPPGEFLQIYGATFQVDCSQKGETLNLDGTRNQEGERVSAVVLTRPDGTAWKTIDPLSNTQTVRLAINSYLLQGQDGFVDFKGLSSNTQDTVFSGESNFEIIARYFLRTYTRQSPLSAQPVKRVDLRSCE